MKRKTTNEPAVETVEVTETVETVEVTQEEVAVNEVTETIETVETVAQSPWELLIDPVDELDVENIKRLMVYCKARLSELQQVEIKALEEEMSKISARLMEMRGGSVMFNSYVPTQKEPKFRDSKGNVWGGMGKRPPWIVELVSSANGDKQAEMAILETVRVKNS